MAENICIVIIGRNEGERLCFGSISNVVAKKVQRSDSEATNIK
jgi:hypothetical protein